MKYSKVAAAVAGSVMALGTVAPALAADGAGEMSPELSVDGALAQSLSPHGLEPQHLDAMQGVHKQGNPVRPVTDAAKSLTGPRNAPQKVADVASHVAPMLGL